MIQQLSHIASLHDDDVESLYSKTDSKHSNLDFILYESNSETQDNSAHNPSDSYGFMMPSHNFHH